MKLVLIGAPAAGKGTQARKLIDKYKLAYISTGDILREHVSNKTELGLKAKSVMDAGKLVSDDLIMDIIKDRISKDDCKKGYILDGFPRTKAQAEMLDALIGSVDKAIYIKVPDEELLTRLTARETCPNCGAIYNKIGSPSKTAGICDVCGESLIQRKDDNYETGLVRLKTFHDTAGELIGHYREQGRLFEIDGLIGIEPVHAAIIAELGEGV